VRQGGWTRLILATLARSLLILVAGLLLWATAPAILGWTPSVVMTGSMQPSLHPGDIAIARPVEPAALRPGQVLLVDDPDHPGKLRLHRYVTTHPDGTLILRGDANNADDSTPIPPEAVHGVGVLRVPYVGTPVVDMTEGHYIRLAAVLLVGVLLLALTIRDNQTNNNPTNNPDPDESPTEPLPAIPQPTRKLRRWRRAGRNAQLLTILACCLATTAAPYPHAYAALSATTSAPNSPGPHRTSPHPPTSPSAHRPAPESPKLRCRSAGPPSPAPPPTRCAWTTPRCSPT
jgi:signal peptidase I